MRTDEGLIISPCLECIALPMCKVRYSNVLKTFDSYSSFELYVHSSYYENIYVEAITHLEANCEILRDFIKKNICELADDNDIPIVYKHLATLVSKNLTDLNSPLIKRLDAKLQEGKRIRSEKLNMVTQRLFASENLNDLKDTFIKNNCTKFKIKEFKEKKNSIYKRNIRGKFNKYGRR